ncbi:MAG TPA: histidine kinase [Terriglobales bacterium]|nr:histidine kinase [Terriglobales bacterium]
MPRVSKPSVASPTPALLFGLGVTLIAVVVYSVYVTRHISSLRRLQTELVDRNRLDSLQLLRIQGNLNSLGWAMRDMVDNVEPYPLTAWSAQFARTRRDLSDALAREQQLAGEDRDAGQRRYLEASVAEFWKASDQIFALANQGQSAQAREQIRSSLQSRQAALNAAVARLLVQNNEAEQQAAVRIGEVYDGVQRQVYWLLAATLLMIVLTSSYLVISSRRIFSQLASLSEQRSELAQKLIATQESTLQHLSRELHDEFGQVLTAIGCMVTRVGKKLPKDPELDADLHELSDTAQAALETVRSFSQALHPVIFDEAGLESAVDWYLPTVERQTGIRIRYEKFGEPFPVASSAGIHVYRVLQESLNNVVRHSGAQEARVRLMFTKDQLGLEIEDDGRGLHMPIKRGVGIVAMKERAGLLGGTIEVASAGARGTRVRLVVPKSEIDGQGT